MTFQRAAQLQPDSTGRPQPSGGGSRGVKATPDIGVRAITGEVP